MTVFVPCLPFVYRSGNSLIKILLNPVTYDFHAGKSNRRWWGTLNTHKWFFKIFCIFELADWLHVVGLLDI